MVVVVLTGCLALYLDYMTAECFCSIDRRTCHFRRTQHTSAFVRHILNTGQSFGSRLSVHSHAGIWGKRSKDLTTINHKIGEGPTNDDGAIWKGLDGLGQ